MYRGDPSSPTQFSVHAEITISHPGDEDSRNRPRTNLERDEATGGIRMTYSWKPEYEGRSQSEDRTSATRRNVWPSSSTNSNISTFSDSRSSATLTSQRPPAQKIVPPSTLLNNNYTRCYQKGNLYFTSTPPSKNTEPIRNIPNDSTVYNPLSRGLVHDSSGYGSDLLSPNSQGNSLPKRTVQQYDRKCRSTCNITLSTNFPGSQELINANYSQCGRTQSLRCQTPSSSIQKNPLRFYGCGDPWCHHLKLEDDLTSVCRISPVPEETTSSTINSKLPSRSNTYTVADHENTKKDASVQTFEMVDKCTSPFSRMNSTDSMDSKVSKKYQRRGLTVPVNFGGKIRTSGSSGKVNSSTGNYTPDSLESVKPSARKLVRSPKLRKMPAKSSNHVKDTKKEQSPALKATTSQKKPRTVHIDVYCTGTEQESSSDSSDEGSKSASTPQTVYENEKVRVTHRKAGEDELPFFLKRIVDQVQNEGPQSLFTKPKVLQKDMSMQKDESDDENASTAYPSKMSSYSNVGDLSGSLSSVPPSWATYSMSSCAIPELDDNDSVANTSWKDTFSDIESLMSRSSLAPTESLDFVPVRKRLETTESIDESPEYLNKLDVPQTPSVASIQASDSFEYANSEDKARIRRMEDMWKFKAGGRFLRSPQVRKQLQMQQKRIQEYMENKISNRKKWDSKDSDSNESDDPGKSYTFIKKSACKKSCCEDVDDYDKPVVEECVKKKSPSNLLPNTIRDALLKSVTPENTPSPDTLSQMSQTPESVMKNQLKVEEDQGSLSDTTPTSPENRSFWQRFSFDPNLRSPFMVVPGIYTEPRSIARRFGNVVRVMKKPGHHVGPAKNPDCLCDHCQSYWQNVGCRNRTRSVGDAPVKFVQNWKELLDQMGNGNDNGHE